MRVRAKTPDEQTAELYAKYAPADPNAFARFDRYLTETPLSMPIFISGTSCWCGGQGGAHRAGCPHDPARPAAPARQAP